MEIDIDTEREPNINFEIINIEDNNDNNVNNVNNVHNVHNVQAQIVIENPVINNRDIQRVRNGINQGRNFHNILMNINNIRDFNNQATNHQIARIRNENQNITRIFNILSLREAREMAGFDNFINFEDFQNIITRDNSTNENNQINQAYLSITYLNYLCAVGDVEIAEQWTQNFLNIHGKYALFVLVNSPMVIPDINYEIYPVFTAALWGNLGMIRLLCELGAQTNILDQYNYYVEEAVFHTRVPYVNPIAHLVNQNIAVNIRIPLGNYRDYNEFIDVVREIRIISGEIIQPINWLPIRFRLNN